MRAQGNGLPQVCATNLMRIIRGEVAYDRLRGLDGTLIDQPNAAEAAEADAAWVLEIYEPRVSAQSILSDTSDALTGDFKITTNIAQKEGEEDGRT